MKTKSLIAVVIMLIFTGCGADSIADLFIPNISNIWQSNRNSQFFFRDYTPNVNKSGFTATEEGIESIDTLAGSFENEKIEFTFSDGADKGIKYKGKFMKDSSPLKMELRGSNGETLILIKREE